MSNASNIIETERLIMRPITDQDLSYVKQLHDDALINDEHFGGTALTDEQLFARLNRWVGIFYAWKHGYHLVFLKGVPEEEGFVGKAALWKLPEFDPPGQIEVGYLILERHRRKGIATEVCDALVKYVFEELDSEIAVAIIDIDNENSVKVVSKLDFTREKNVVMEERGDDEKQVYRKYRSGTPAAA